MSEEKKPFWSTLPGILTGIAAVITAITTLYITVINKDTSDISTSSEKIQGQELEQTTDSRNTGWVLIGEDTFTDLESKWPSGSFAAIEGFKRLDIRVVGGKYRVDFESIGKQSRYFDSPYGASLNFRMAVDIRMVEFSSDHILAGVHFGYSSGVGYLFTFLPTGKWGVHKTNAPNVPVVEWTNAGLKPKDWNRLEVEVIDNYIKLRINSKLVAEFKDTENKGGILGLYVGADDENGIAVVDFDNFEYYRKESN